MIFGTLKSLEGSQSADHTHCKSYFLTSVQVDVADHFFACDFGPLQEFSDLKASAIFLTNESLKSVQLNYGYMIV